MKRLSLAFLSMMSITACAPRDVAIVSDADRAKFLGQKNGGANTAAGTVFKLGSYSLGAHMIERQAEAVQTLRWILDPSLASKEGRSVVAKPGNRVDEGSTVTEGLNTKATTHFSVSSRSLLDVTAKQLPQEGKDALHGWTAAGFAQANWLSTDDAALKFELLDGNRDLQIEELAQIGQYHLVYQVAATLNMENKDGKDSFPLAQKYDFVVQRGEGDSFSIVSGTGSLTITIAGSSKVFTTKNDKALKLSWGQCLNIEGQATMTSGRPVALVFTKDNFTVGTTFQIPFEVCEKRTTVDLYRLVATPVNPSKKK